MTTISNLPKELQGKKITICQGTLDIDLQFGLWADYTYWLDSDKQLEFWHDSTLLEKENVTVEITLGDTIVFKKVFTKFENITLHHVFDDTVPGACNLTLTITNLNNLPIRDNTGIFVSGLFKINSIKLQGVEITHLLNDTMFGTDSTISIPMSKPIYSWMVANYQIILPKVFNFPMRDIEIIN